jgi:GDP-4-dehydro-6-deoxy-D-mannose reductase
VKALVTGAGGFAGRWLIEHLESAGDDVWRATSRPQPDADRQRALDLLDPASVSEVMAWSRPDAVYHLAAVTFGPEATRDVARAIDVTVRGTALLLEAASALAEPPIILVPSSSEVYGGANEALDELRPLAPMNVYGATKVGQEALALAYHRAGRVQVAIARAFNHIGPGQRDSFVVASFANQLAKIAAGQASPTLRVGNLEARRDFTDVRDVVRAYRLLVAGAHTGQPFNVASGRALTIRAVLDSLIALTGLSVDIAVDAARLRPLDVPTVVGDASRLRQTTGWRPTIPLETTLNDLWQDATACT